MSHQTPDEHQPDPPLILPPPDGAPGPSEALALVQTQHGAAGLQAVATFVHGLGHDASICWERGGEKTSFPAEHIMQEAWARGGNPVIRADTERLLDLAIDQKEALERRLKDIDTAVADLSQEMTGDRVQKNGAWGSAVAMLHYLRQHAQAGNRMMSALTRLLWDTRREATTDSGRISECTLDQIKRELGDPPDLRPPPLQPLPPPPG